MNELSGDAVAGKGVEPQIGALLVMTGLLFRFLVIGFAYIKRGGKDGQVYADKLVTQGFYAHVRNPMYMSNFLIFMGLSLIYGSGTVYFLVIPFFSFAYYAIVVVEEDYLKKQFGASFNEYCRRVNRFFPDFRGVRRSLKEFHYDWRKAIRKDYGTFFGVLMGCYITWLWKSYYFHVFPHNRRDVWSAAFVLAGIVLSYGLIRYLKKSGRLQSPSLSR